MYKILFLALIFTSCNQVFDKAKWQDDSDITTHRYRKYLIEDLIENYKIIGLSYPKLIDLLGKPEQIEKNEISYEIETNYGTNIDPIYIKYLQINLTKDSIVQNFKILEHKH